tara:strand:- start:510 stop:902 length:393 start_codon:yes stop_codon:yes gene_type:complete
MAEVINPISKIRILNKLPLPEDVINEIYKYVFYDITKFNFYKKKSKPKENINQLVSSAFSRKNIPYWLENNITQDMWETKQTWMFGFSWPDTGDMGIIQGENCSKCGDYIWVGYSSHPNIPSKVKLCNCV